MVQTAPPLLREPIARHLPRGMRSLRPRLARPRLQPIDAAWIAGAVAVYAIAHLAMNGRGAASPKMLAVGAVVVILAYLLAARLAGRAAAVIAALLLATCSSFAESHFSLTTELFVALSVAALFAFASESSLVALIFAGAAVWIRPEGALLGAILLIAAWRQHRRRGRLGAIAFIALAASGFAASSTPGYADLALRSVPAHSELLSWLASPGALITAWFLLPFCGEAADRSRRVKWLPLLFWAAILLVAGLAVEPKGSDKAALYLAAFLPIWFIVIGAGVARLLPFITGEMPMLTLRYAIAVLAVAMLIGVRARLEWPTWHPVAVQRPVLDPGPKPALLPAPEIIAPKPTPSRKSAQVPKPVPLHHAVVPHPASVAKAVRAMKPATTPHIYKPSRRVYRSRWSSRWRRTYRHR